MTREQAIEKLKRVKALLDRPGTEGEREAARKMYNRLLEQYQLEESAVADTVKTRWFHYKNRFEKKLLNQVIYAVTGDSAKWKRHDGRSREYGVDCTEAEAIEIEFLFNFYNEAFTKELDIFMSAFISANNIFPDDNARCYNREKEEAREITAEELERYEKAARMAKGIDKSIRPRALIED